ncbi:hypothetical protein M9H77_15852 [Catharanthus roseus]|uniref:Uncharacterized protein n=1 Tax=Catharanthus roseus TaxID=4058 RepID=A0ACC0B0F8_CATRO|nr:hypothetical protein M9H77_15852 [Catharanthus roseus]
MESIKGQRRKLVKARVFVQEQWGNDEDDFMDMVKSFTLETGEWHRNVFENIVWKKKNLVARLTRIQLAFEQGPSNFLAELENELIAEYSQVLKQEELYWFQKTRAKWFTEGEINTHFFSFISFVETKYAVSMLKDANGNWVQEQGSLKAMVRNFYVQLYAFEPCSRDSNSW